mgnify:CR=1 FL=1
MKKPTLEEILKVASFDYDEEGKLILTKLDADLIGNHKGNHVGDHDGDHEGDHIGNHFGTHEGNHWGDHIGDHITPKPEKTAQNKN